MILSGDTISNYAAQGEPLISPHNERSRINGMTYGVGPAGYDVRVEFDEKGSVESRFLYPGDFILASTVEQFSMRPDVMGIVHDKSTLARLGIAVQNTVIEPGWCGWLTLEITNHGLTEVELFRGQPIAQIIFHRVDRAVSNSYDGKYHNQKRGPVAAILEK